MREGPGRQGRGTTHRGVVSQVDEMTSTEALAHARALLAEVREQVAEQAEEIARIRRAVGRGQ